MKNLLASIVDGESFSLGNHYEMIGGKKVFNGRRLQVNSHVYPDGSRGMEFHEDTPGSPPLFAYRIKIDDSRVLHWTIAAGNVFYQIPPDVKPLLSTADAPGTANGLREIHAIAVGPDINFAAQSFSIRVLADRTCLSSPFYNPSMVGNYGEFCWSHDHSRRSFTSDFGRFGGQHYASDDRF